MKESGGYAWTVAYFDTGHYLPDAYLGNWIKHSVPFPYSSILTARVTPSAAR